MTSIKKVINLKSDAITIEHLEIQILEMYKLSNNKSNDSEDSAKEQETAMINFTGKCYNYGKEGHCANVCPKKNAPCSGFVKNSANIHSVGQYSIVNLSLSTLSFTKKYLMDMCLELPACA
jgi:hypothetical protein